MNAPFSLDNRLSVVLFAGMGGGCDGLEDAGFHVHVAINHDPVAVAVHEIRHPHTRHLRCDVFEADPRKVCGNRGVRVLHASPDCTHFSVAKGSKPVSKRRRSLAWVICRWAGSVRPETITMENVQEITTWGPLVAKRCPLTGRVLRLDGSVAAKCERVPIAEQWLVPDPRHKGRIWRAWLKHLRGLGYHFEHRVLVCADYGVPTIRKRFFGVAKADGGPVQWPQRTHAPRKDAKRLGLKPWVGAHTIIDWSLPVKSIFGRKKDLAEATLRRTARGVMRYVVDAAKPFIVPITHSGGDRVHDVDEPLRTLTTAHRGELSVVAPHIAKFRTGASGADIEEPLPTVTANSFEKRPGGAIPLGLAAATLVDTAHGEGMGRGVSEWSLDDPLRTIGASGGKAVVAAHMTKFNQNGDGYMPTEPLDTVIAGAPRHAVVAANLVSLAHGDTANGGINREHDVLDPVKTIHAGGGNVALVAAFMAQHNTGEPGRSAEDPLSTIVTLGSTQGVIAATLGNLRGTNKDGRDIAEPLATVSAGGSHAHLIAAFLQTYYGSGDNNHDLAAPIPTVTTKERHALVQVMVRGVPHYIDDIGIRMLEPEEGAAAHEFRPGSLPAEITIDGKTRRLTKTEKYHLVGNSVPPRMIRLLAECNVRHAFAEAAE
jgi:DNA (cytosine-5)-methyltransferase 1